MIFSIVLTLCYFQINESLTNKFQAFKLYSIFREISYNKTKVKKNAFPRFYDGFFTHKLSNMPLILILHSSLRQESAQLKHQKNYPKQTKANFRLIGTKSNHRDNKTKIYRDFFRDIGPNRSKVGPNGQILSF